jgi:hypothetical protein
VFATILGVFGTHTINHMGARLFEQLGDSPGDAFLLATPVRRNTFPSKSSRPMPPIEPFLSKMKTNIIRICTFPYYLYHLLPKKVNLRYLLPSSVPWKTVRLWGVCRTRSTRWSCGGVGSMLCWIYGLFILIFCWTLIWCYLRSRGCHFFQIV